LIKSTFVAVNQIGKAAYSTDKGKTWSPANGGQPLWDTPTSGEIGIAYDKRKNMFVVVSDGGVAAYSEDGGINWETINDSNLRSIDKFDKIDWGCVHFLVGGYTTDNRGKLLYSEDGKTWNVTGDGVPEENMTNYWDNELPYRNIYVIKVGMEIVYGIGRFLVVNHTPSGIEAVLLSELPK
jgi:hypothetical protein